MQNIVRAAFLSFIFQSNFYQVDTDMVLNNIEQIYKLTDHFFDQKPHML